LLESVADLAVVVGGYNSTNTSHIVELCERKFPTYFITSEKEIISREEIHHFDCRERTMRRTQNFLPSKNPTGIILTSGASCPDTLVDRVMIRLLEFYSPIKSVEDVLKQF
jgi:4-hydroxy-3-methylbut-2-enyl diphosphate reductase